MEGSRRAGRNSNEAANTVVVAAVAALVLDMAAAAQMAPLVSIPRKEPKQRIEHKKVNPQTQSYRRYARGGESRRLRGR